MLVLSRNLGNKLMIGEKQEITITVLEISEHQVKLGVEAARNIPVMREEILKNFKQRRILKKYCKNN